MGDWGGSGHRLRATQQVRRQGGAGEATDPQLQLAAHVLGPSGASLLVEAAQTRTGKKAAPEAQCARPSSSCGCARKHGQPGPATGDPQSSRRRRRRRRRCCCCLQGRQERVACGTPSATSAYLYAGANEESGAKNGKQANACISTRAGVPDRGGRPGDFCQLTSCQRTHPQQAFKVLVHLLLLLRQGKERELGRRVGGAGRGARAGSQRGINVHARSSCRYKGGGPRPPGGRPGPPPGGAGRPRPGGLPGSRGRPPRWETTAPPLACLVKRGPPPPPEQPSPHPHSRLCRLRCQLQQRELPQPRQQPRRGALYQQEVGGGQVCRGGARRRQLHDRHRHRLFTLLCLLNL